MRSAEQSSAISKRIVRQKDKESNNIKNISEDLLKTNIHIHMGICNLVFPEQYTMRMAL